MLDRIDLHVEVAAVPAAMLTADESGESSATVRARVVAAASRQHVRQGCSNASLQGKTLARHAGLSTEDRDFLVAALEKMRLSARASDRVLRVARTIADLDGGDAVERSHLCEALGYRAFDRTVR